MYLFNLFHTFFIRSTPGLIRSGVLQSHLVIRPDDLSEYYGSGELQILIRIKIISFILVNFRCSDSCSAIFFRNSSEVIQNMQHWTWYLLEILRRPGFPSSTQTRLVPNSCVRKSTRTKLQKSSMSSILKVIVHLAASRKRIPFGKLLIQAISIAPVDVFKQNFNFVKSCFHILWLCFVLCPVRKSFSCTMPSSLCTIGRKTCAINVKKAKLYLFRLTCTRLLRRHDLALLVQISFICHAFGDRRPIFQTILFQKFLERRS